MVSALLQKVVATTTKRAVTIPELEPWREIGWIFKDGGVIAIERQGGETRIREAAI